MTDDEFDKYLNDARTELREKQSALADHYRLGTAARFVVDHMEGTLTTFDNENPIAEARIIPIATHFPDQERLLWAWSNEHLPPDMRSQAAKVRDLYKVTGFDLFKDDPVACDEVMAWDIAALACKHLGTLGAYRMPNKDAHSYVLITDIKALS